MFFSGPTENENETFWARTRLVDGKLTETITIRLSLRDQLIPAPDGQHYCLVSYDPKSIKIVPGARGNSTTLQISDLDKFPISVAVKRWESVKDDPLVLWKTRHQNLDITWHTQGKYLAVQDRYAQRLFLLDLANQSWTNHFIFDPDNTSPYPVESGWLLVAPDRLKRLGHAGELRSTWQLGVRKPHDLMINKPWGTGAWIGANGAIPAGLTSGTLQIVYRKDQRICVQPLSEFQDSPDHPPLPVFPPDVKAE